MLIVFVVAGFPPSICEGIWLKYGSKGPLKERTDLFAVLVTLKMDPTTSQYPLVLRESRSTGHEKLKQMFAWLQTVVSDIDWDDRLSPLNHTTHFPYFVSFFVDTVPVACFGGVNPENFQPKYAGNVYKMQVCCDALGRIVYFSGPHPGAMADATIWKRHGPKEFVGLELGLGDGAYSGNFRLIAPFRKEANTKTLPLRKERYNRLHSFFRARISQVLI